MIIIIIMMIMISVFLLFFMNIILAHRSVVQSFNLVF